MGILMSLIVQTILLYTTFVNSTSGTDHSIYGEFKRRHKSFLFYSSKFKATRNDKKKN